MKTVNVFVCIQMDIPNKDEDNVSEVQAILNKMNEDLLQSSPLDSNAQIFVDEVDFSKIVNGQSTLCIYDEVEVPDPDEAWGDLHNHGFVGTLIEMRGDIGTVRDGDDDCWDIELERLTKV